MMKNHRLSHYPAVLVYALLISGFSLSVSAEPLTLTAVTEKGYRASLDPIEVRIGNEMSADLIPYLRLEIDAIDVTDFVTHTGQLLTFTPPQALEPGSHHLRVVAVLPDGVIEEAAVWTFEIRASEAFRISEVNGQLDLQVMQRIADDLINAPDSRIVGQGAIGLNSQHADNAWTTSTQANLFYNSQESQGLTGKRFDLVDYQINTDWTQSSLTLGHQTLPANSLVLNQFTRRGVSASTRTESNALQFTGFGTRTEEITGINHLTGLDDSDHQTNGLILSAYPLGSKPERLAITAVYLDGRGSAEGVAQIDDTNSNAGGHARAIIIDSQLQDKLWRLRGEHARSSFDFDGVNSGFDAIEDDATNLLIDYDTSRTDTMTEQPDSTWGVSVIHQKVGPWFYSLGNTTNTVDRRTTQLLGNYQSDGFGMNGTMSLGEDNVDKLNTLPTTRIESAAFNLNYTPRQDAQFGQQTDQDGAPAQSIFSNPAYTLSWTQNSLDQIKTPTGYTGDDVNSYYNELALTATFSGSDWYWSLSHSLINQDDKVNAGNNAQTVSTGLESQLTLNEYLSISPILQQSATDYSNLHITSRTWLAAASLNLNYPANWSNSFSYTVNRETSSDDSIDTLTRIAEMAVQWHYREAGHNRFGLVLFSTASHRYAEVSDMETAEYQVFVGANIGLPVQL